MAGPVHHYPTLETILMIEGFIQEHSGKYTKSQIWKNLPRKMMYQTFCVAFDYLVDSNKIFTDLRNKKIVWIWDQDLVKKILIRKEAGKFTREVVKAYGGKMVFRPTPLKRFRRPKVFQKPRTGYRE
jgi:hypothetical protein